MIHLPRFLLLLSGLTLLMATPAAAQFETPNRQFHDATTFRLEGRHLDVSCESCHLDGVYTGTPTQCADCHWTRRQDDRFRLQLGAQCEQCHTPAAWTSARFDHGVMTTMPLNGAHQQLACQTCHENNSFLAAQSDCVSCHLEDYQSTRAPDHVAATFPTTCEACHSASHTSFNQARFDHQAVFPLVGQHATLTCEACHQSSIFLGTATDCVGCHQTAYDRTTAPNHAAAGFSTDCQACHNATDASFIGADFDHQAVFPLVGQHAAQTCAACHQNGVYRGTPVECVACHQAAYDRTTAPNHAAAGFSIDCQVCHRATDASFTGATFNHTTFYPLVGQHASLACASCHDNGVYRGTATDCVGCHRSTYDNTRSPNHPAAGFPTACDNCHGASDSSWGQGRFSHRFPITGRHNTECSTCHQSSSYQDFTCLTCHEHSQSEMDSEHRRRNGYRYESRACYSCHPDGRADDD
jgi:hypothetical protein